jgi:hypothetical protein
MSHYLKIKPLRKDEKGIAILETALLLPFLILCSLVVFDIGRIFYSYLMLSEIAREAAMNGARIPQLKGNGTADDFFEHDLNQLAAPANMGGHEIIRSRVKLARYLLRDTIPIPLTDIQSQSQCVHAAEVDLDLDNNGTLDGKGRVVRVRVEGAYQSLFYPGRPLFNIRAEEVMGYLGGDPCDP